MAAIPAMVLFAFLIGGFVVVATELQLGLVAVAGGLALTGGLVAAVLYTAGLSALGGYLAVWLTEDRNAAAEEGNEVTE